MSNPDDKAKEIERALGERKDADQAFNDKLDKLLEAVDGVTKRVDAMESSRKDADEDKAKEARKDGEVRNGEVTFPYRGDAVRNGHELAKLQARADSVSHMFGSSAPRPMDGEKPHAYRVRLLSNFQHNSPDFKDIDLRTVEDEATFDAIETRIYADSANAAATPLVPVGELREVQTRDTSGRMISTFHGEPRAWMRHFMMEPALVERINRE